ncbi:MAG: hypothetical protein HZB26_18170 [Candidatus Hydrogenedentes bacterium]|nr:hypothetical protein [Candidatus Hydrogenedentota bacterium]
MAGLTMTKIRAFAAAVLTIVLVVVFAAIVAKLFNVRLPILGAITDRLGF